MYMYYIGGFKRQCTEIYIYTVSVVIKQIQTNETDDEDIYIIYHSF